MSVRVCVCVCVCMYACMLHVCMYTHTHTHTHTQLHENLLRLSSTLDEKIANLNNLTAKFREFQEQKNNLQGQIRISSPKANNNWSPEGRSDMILDLFTTSLPTKSVSPCVSAECRQEGDYYLGGYARGYLHVRTNLICGLEDYQMYHLVFRGHLFVSSISFHCEAVGYVNPVGYMNSIGHSNTGAWCNPGSLQIYGYCAPESKDLVFRFAEPNHDTSYWHASGLSVDFYGYNQYHRRAAEYIMIKEATHSSADTMW